MNLIQPHYFSISTTSAVSSTVERDWLDWTGGSWPIDCVAGLIGIRYLLEKPLEGPLWVASSHPVHRGMRWWRYRFRWRNFRESEGKEHSGGCDGNHLLACAAEKEPRFARASSSLPPSLPQNKIREREMADERYGDGGNELVVAG